MRTSFLMTPGCFAIAVMSWTSAGVFVGPSGAAMTGGTHAFTAGAATCPEDFWPFALFFASRSAVFASRSKIFACAAANTAAFLASSSASFADRLVSSAARFSSFLPSRVVGEATGATGAAGVNDVAAAGATLNGLFVDVNGLGAEPNRACSGGSTVVGGGGGAAGAAAGGANENGEFGELKMEGTCCSGGCFAAGGGLVKGSGYSGMVLAAAENGFDAGLCCDGCAGCQSPSAGGPAGAAGVSSTFS